MLHSWESGANQIETSFGNEDQAAFNLIQHNNLAYASSNDMFRQLKTYTEKEKEREREREEPKKKPVELIMQVAAFTAAIFLSISIA